MPLLIIYLSLYFFNLIHEVCKNWLYRCIYVINYKESRGISCLFTILTRKVAWLLQGNRIKKKNKEGKERKGKGKATFKFTPTGKSSIPPIKIKYTAYSSYISFSSFFPTINPEQYKLR